jgi:hypothetical protein
VISEIGTKNPSEKVISPVLNKDFLECPIIDFLRAGNGRTPGNFRGCHQILESVCLNNRSGVGCGRGRRASFCLRTMAGRICFDKVMPAASVC